MTVSLNSNGLMAQGYLNEINIGPLKISGRGADQIIGTDDDGAIVELNITKSRQQLSASGIVELIGIKSSVDIIFGLQGITFFTTLNILSLFKTKLLAESRGSGKNLDFVVMGALGADFTKFIETQGAKAIGELTDLATSGIDAVKRQLKHIDAAIRPLNKAQDKLKKKFKNKRETFNRKTRLAGAVIGPAEKALRKAQDTVNKLKKKIKNMRETIKKEREKILGALRKARSKVNSLSKQVKHANSKAAHYKPRKLDWPWKMAGDAVQYAIWKARAGIVEAARWVASKALQGILKTINIIPIDADPRIIGLWAAYTAALVPLKSAEVALSAARLASNPASIQEAAEMAALGIQIATIEASKKSLEISRAATQVSLEIAKIQAEAFGEAVEFTMKAGSKLAGKFSPFIVTGGSISFSVRETITGKFPTLGLRAKIFGKTKNLTMSIDLKKPETFITALPKLLLRALNLKYKGEDLFAKIESIRLKNKKDIEQLEKAKEEAHAEKERLEAEEKKRLEEVAKLKAENKIREAQVEKTQLKKTDDVGALKEALKT